MAKGNDRETQASKYISFLLRHNTDPRLLSLDESGWTQTEKLVESVAKNHWSGFSRAMLNEIVAKDNKGRYSFSEDGTKIRANQGHSVNVDLQLAPVEPPEFLWHGTATRFVDAIFAEGLKRMARTHVHLSVDRVTATAVGQRHGKLAMFQVLAKQMHADGFAFFISENHVWLTESVPAKYLVRAD